MIFLCIDHTGAMKVTISMVAQKLIVPDGQIHRRLETFLGKRFPIGYVRKLFRKNGVRVNGRRAKALDQVQPGDCVEVFLPFESRANQTASPRTDSPHIDVIFENADLLVINKPAGLAVHEAKTISQHRTLLGLLEKKYRGAPFKPRLVHRLDKETSGVLLAAKNNDAAQEIESYFEAGKVKKEYLCMVAGRLPQNTGTIDFPLSGREGKPVRAITHFRVEHRFSNTTLINVTIETGRMHQIRLHCAKLGYPVVLDSQHGDFSFNKAFRKSTGLKRQFLHAARLAVTYRGKQFQWAAPLPDDLQRTLQILSATRHHLFKVQGSKF
jgi:RluA family pseudouridine synthase